VAVDAAHHSQPAPTRRARHAIRSALARATAMVAAMLALGALAWEIIANTAADTAVRSNPEEALAWRGDSAAALVLYNEDRLRAAAAASDDLAAIEAGARRAIIANPLEAGALRLLAVVADVRGNDAQAATLMELATARSKRDTGAWLWLLDQAVRNEDVQAAVDSADVILRTQPDMAETLFPSLLAIGQKPGGEAALAAALARDPRWRGFLLSRLPRDPLGAPVAFALLSDLAATSHSPRSGEIGAYLDAVIASGDYLRALLTWMRFLPPDQARSVPFVYNGDFEIPVTGLAFDWALGSIRGAQTEVVDTREQGVGHALRVVFADTRVPYRQASKLLYLPAGSYRLTGKVKADGLMTARGLRWRIACAEGDKQQLAETQAISGTLPWTPFDEAFTVPAIGCSAQWLRLELDARVASEQQISGTFWTDALVATRAPLPTD
jgi:hypothetical protein